MALSGTEGGLNFVFESGWTDGPMLERGVFKAKDGGTTKELDMTYQANVWYSTKLVLYPKAMKYDFYAGERGTEAVCLARGFAVNASLSDFQRILLSPWTSGFYVDNLRFLAGGSSDITVRITAPESQGTAVSGRPITIQAEAAAPAGSAAEVQKLEFYVNGSLAGTCYQAPYAVSYTPQGNGDLYIYAEVSDSLGLKARSETVTAHVDYSGEAPPPAWLSVIDADFDSGFVPPPVTPFRDKDGTIECLDSTAEGQTDDGHGKVLRVAKSGSAMPYLILNAGEPGIRYVLEADFRLGATYGVSTNFVSEDGNTKVNGFNIESGYIGLPNGAENKKLKEVTPGQWYSLRFEFDIINSVCSLSVDGEPLAENFAFPAEIPDFSSFLIYNWMNQVEYAIDNVRLSKEDTARYNPAFIETDFSDGVPANVKMIKNDGTIELLDGEAGRAFIDDAHGAALKVAHGPSGNAPYLQLIRPEGCADTGYVLEADIYLGSDPEAADADKSYGISTNMVGDNSAKPEGFNIESGGAGISGYSGRYAVAPGNWYHLRFAFDLVSKTCSLYVDGNLLTEDQPIKNGESVFHSLRIFNWNTGSFYVIDNLAFKTVLPGVRLTQLTLTDPQGGAVTQVSEGNAAAKALFCNDTDTPASAVLGLAVYENDALVQMAWSGEVTVQPHASASASALVNICGGTAGKSLKVFVWKDRTELEPFDGTMVQLTAQ